MAAVIAKNGKHTSPTLAVYKGKIVPGKGVTVSAVIKDGRHILTPEQAKFIIVLRVSSKEKNGYQRPLKLSRVKEIVTDLKKKKASDYPEILVANVNGQLQCVDGQHRLQAHIDAGVPIPACVRTMTQKQAVKIFLRDNYKAKPLQFRDFVLASDSPRCLFMRELEKEFGISLNHARKLMVGLDSETLNKRLIEDGDFTDHQKRAAQTILNTWCADTRWEPDSCREPRKNNLPTTQSAFSSKTTFYVLGRLARRHLDERDYIGRIKEDMGIIKTSDWSKASGRSLRGLQGGNNFAQKALLTYIQTEILLPAK